MNLSLLRKKPVFYIILSGFIIMILVQLALIDNAYKGKEKDFNDKLFYVVRFYESQVLKDTSVMNTITGDSAAVLFAQTRVKNDIESAFRKNEIPGDFVFGVGKFSHDSKRLLIDTSRTLFWSNDSVNNANLNATKLRIANLGPAGADIYYIKIFLPHKPTYLFKSLLPLIIILVLTLLTLFFCFLALASIIRNQLKLAELKNDFINNMTHELKTPLFTISIASKMLAEQGVIKENDKYVSYVESIQQETGRLTKLVDKVLQTSSLEKKQLQLDKKNMDLHAAIRAAIESLELIRVEQQATIELCLDAGRHYIYADETHMTSVIYSLLDNAFKYSNGPAHVTISSRNVDNSIVIWIADKGIGLDPATKELVFERFFRAHTGNLHNVKGYGIGLSYVKSIIDAHDGSVAVESKPGKGSEFILILPCTSHGD